MDNYCDVVIVGTGVSGLFAALNLPKDKKIILITKSQIEESDSFLAQGGICVLKNNEDYEAYYQDTMKAGHYKNRPESVEIMIRSSRDIINDLVELGVEFETENGKFAYTREGAHSTPRILFHKDQTGKEITSKLIEKVKLSTNIEILEHTTMIDIIENSEKECCGIVVADVEGNCRRIYSDYTVLASGGIGGLFEHSTNYSHLTGDSIAISVKHGIKLKDLDFIQVHPTTFYSLHDDRNFLISESMRGEGAVLLDKNLNRFVDELLPRDILTEEIYKQMKKDKTSYVLLSMKNIPGATLKSHFPNIYKHCLDNGYNVPEQPIPVVPAQHYFMGGIEVDKNSLSSMPRLYAVGETSCNGVHGANRLASNSLLESLVFAKRAAEDIAQSYSRLASRPQPSEDAKKIELREISRQYKACVLHEIERMRKEHE